MKVVVVNTQTPEELLNNARVIHTPAEVQNTLIRISKEISDVVSDKTPIVICVMGGGVVFAGQLLTQLNFPLELDYVHASRYHNQTVGKTIEWKSLPKQDLTNRTVLLIDDILDEGVTLKTIADKCLALGAKEVFSAVFVEKVLDIIKPIKADFVGLQVPNAYVFGYGMDVYGWWRNLDAIYAMQPEP